MVKILGHRGARGVRLENSLPAFIYAHHLYQQGLDGIEFDIQLTQDGEFCVFHDETLQRLCQQQSYVNMMTTSALKHIRQSTSLINHDKQEMLFLSDMKPFLQGFSHIEMEIKTHERTNHHHVLSALSDSYCRYDLSDFSIVMTSFDTTILSKLHHHPDFSSRPRGLLVENESYESLRLDEKQWHSWIETQLSMALRLGCCQIGWHYPLLDDAVVTLCHRYDLSVTAWTVNDIKDASYLISLGVDTLITDYPKMLLHLRDDVMSANFKQHF